MIAGTGDWGRFGLLVGNLFADDLDLMSYIHVPWQVRLIECFRDIPAGIRRSPWGYVGGGFRLALACLVPL